MGGVFRRYSTAVFTFAEFMKIVRIGGEFVLRLNQELQNSTRTRDSAQVNAGHSLMRINLDNGAPE